MKVWPTTPPLTRPPQMDIRVEPVEGRRLGDDLKRLFAGSRFGEDDLVAEMHHRERNRLADGRVVFNHKEQWPPATLVLPL